jgi:hypothetical protein
VWTACSSNWEHWSEKPDIWTKWTLPLTLDKSTSTWKGGWPEGTTIPVGESWEPWNANWATCTGTVDTWATCSVGLVLTISKTCSTNWETEAEYINTLNQWEPWATGCRSCDAIPTNCDKCKNNYIFYNNTWSSGCPDGFVNENVDGIDRWILEGLDCDYGYKIDTTGTKWILININWDKGYTLNGERTRCIPNPGTLVPFPFLLIFWVMLIFIVIGYCK